MADRISQESNVTMVMEFSDGDDRSLTMPNPDTYDKAALTAKVNALKNYLKETQLLLGDKTGAEFTRFKSAKASTKRVTQLDLS